LEHAKTRHSTNPCYSHTGTPLFEKRKNIENQFSTGVRNAFNKFASLLPLQSAFS